MCAETETLQHLAKTNTDIGMTRLSELYLDMVIFEKKIAWNWGCQGFVQMSIFTILFFLKFVSFTKLQMQFRKLKTIIYLYPLQS